ncbi:hypothetical protein REPUB_Repub19eG0008700 [Reevesia pubescens]
MADEHANKVPDCGGEGAVETKDRGWFDFLGKKVEENKPQEETKDRGWFDFLGKKEEVIATEFDEKDRIEETKTEVEHKEEGEEKKHNTLLEKFHQSSSNEEEGEGKEKNKKEEKKGLKENIEEKLGGEKKKEEAIKHEVTTIPVENKPQEEVIATKFDENVKIEETKAEVKHKEEGEEKKHSTLLEKFHQSDSSSRSSSNEEEGEGKEKKGLKENIEEKLGGEKKEDEVTTVPVENKPQEEVIATEFDEKVKIEETMAEGEEKKHSTLLEKFHQPYSRTVVNKPQEEVIATEFDEKVKIEETMEEGEEKKHSTLLEKFHQPYSRTVVNKPQEEVIATEFDEKVKTEETKAEVEHKEEGEEKKHSTLLEKFHQPYSSFRSSSNEEEGEGKKNKGLKENIEEKLGGEKKDEEAIKHEVTTYPVEKCDEQVVHPESEPEKKGFLHKMRDKLPGQHKQLEEFPTPMSPFDAPHEGETKEKRGIMEKIKDKLHHSKTEE